MSERRSETKSRRVTARRCRTLALIEAGVFWHTSQRKLESLLCRLKPGVVLAYSRYDLQGRRTSNLTQRCGTTLATACDAVIASQSRHAQTARQPRCLAQLCPSSQTICNVYVALNSKGETISSSRPLALGLLGFWGPLGPSIADCINAPEQYFAQYLAFQLSGRYAGMCSRSSLDRDGRTQLSVACFACNAVSAIFACSASSVCRPSREPHSLV